MLYLRTAISAILLIAISLPALAATVQNINMFKGQIELIDLYELPSRVALGDGKKVRLEILEKERQVLLIGEEVGSTSLRLWFKNEASRNYNIRVTRDDPETRINIEQMVKFKVRITEFRKSALTKIGVDWSDSIAGPTYALAADAMSTNYLNNSTFSEIAGAPVNLNGAHAYLGMASELTSRINLLASNGEARTLAEPSISALNGKKASFLAGGEVPFPVTNANGATSVQFKNYGVKLDILPVIGSDGLISAQVMTEVSQIDPAVNVMDAPGFLTRRAETQVNLRSGDTMVISGLMSSESSEDANSIPGISKIPIVGELFKSNNFRKNLTELVIFVTPELDQRTMSRMESETLAETQSVLDEIKRVTPMSSKMHILE